MISNKHFASTLEPKFFAILNIPHHFPHPFQGVRTSLENEEMAKRANPFEGVAECASGDVNTLKKLPLHTTSILVIILFVLPFIQALEVEAQTDQNWTIKIVQLNTSINALRAERKIPGMAVAISKDGKLIYNRGFGHANLEKQEAASSQTLFRLASVSKLLTIACIAKLQETGKLDIHAPIETYLPDYPHAGKGITTKLLCGHLGGIRHYKAKDFLNNNKHFSTTEEALATFIQDDLEHDPGTTYRYTTFGFVLLQGIVEATSGQPFLEYLDKEILQPLDMNRTVPDQKDSLYHNRSALYKMNRKGKVKASSFDDPSYKWGGGGMLSCVEDLVAFGNAHLQAGFFSQATLDSLFRPQVLMPRSETHIGLGWRISTDANGKTIYHHAGNMNGARALLLLYPEENIVIAVQNNLSNLGRILPFAMSMKEAIFAEEFEVEAFDFVELVK